MKNLPKVKPGIVAVSRDCFPIELSRKRRENVVKECRKKGLRIVKIETIVENERDAMKALEEVRAKGVNALVIYLGNFGPEGPTTILAKVRRAGHVRHAAEATCGKTLMAVHGGRGPPRACRTRPICGASVNCGPTSPNTRWASPQRSPT